MLNVVEFTEIKELLLKDVSPRDAVTLYNTPITMDLAVFFSFSNPQVQAPILGEVAESGKGVGRHYTAWEEGLEGNSPILVQERR